MPPARKQSEIVSICGRCAMIITSGLHLCIVVHRLHPQRQPQHHGFDSGIVIMHAALLAPREYKHVHKNMNAFSLCSFCFRLYSLHNIMSVLVRTRLEHKTPLHVDIYTPIPSSTHFPELANSAMLCAHYEIIPVHIAGVFFSVIN